MTEPLAAGDSPFARQLAAAIAGEEQRYVAANPRSQEQYRQACRWLPGGSTRATVYYPPFPLTIDRGDGACLWDIDQHRYLDFLGEYTAGVYGHDRDLLQRILQEIAAHGMMLGGPTVHEARLAELICARFPSCEMVRFCNSGTEANLLALALARRATGRDLVLVFQGAYHGGVLTFGQQDAPLNVPLRTVQARYNDIDGTRSVLAGAGREVGAILVEPMMGAAGCIPGTVDFLQLLRDEATSRGAVLIFDEVMTSRLAPGGLQQALGISPDLTTFGKYLGGGFSFGAVGGSRRLLAMLDARNPDALLHGGTFNNNIASMIGGSISLGERYTAEACRQLNALGDQLRQELNQAAAGLGVPLVVTGRGAVMGVHFARGPIRAPDDTSGPGRAALRTLLHLALLRQGIYIASRGLLTLNLLHTAADLQACTRAFGEFAVDHADLLRQLP